MMMTLIAGYPERQVSERYDDIQKAAESADKHRANGAVSISIKMHMVKMVAHYPDHDEVIDTFIDGYDGQMAAEKHIERGARRISCKRI